MREMSASKTPWISEYPVDWKQIPLHALFEEHKNKNRNGEEQNLLSLSYGKIIRKDINTNEGLLPESFNGYNVIDEGDIVLRLTDLQNDHRSLRTGLVTERGIITSAYVTLRKKIPLSSEYYHYLLHSFDIMKVFYSMGEGIRQSLDYDELAYIILPHPSLDEQYAIVRYLDTKCSAIDEAINRHKKIIEKLDEYLSAYKYKLVIHGTKSDCECRTTSIAWFPQMPNHWDMIRMQDVASYKKGPFGSSITINMFVDKAENTYKIYEQKNAIQANARLGNYYISQDHFEKLEGFSVCGGDVIVSCAGTIGKCYILPDDIEKGIINQALMRVRIREGFNKIYFVFLFDIVLRFLNEKHSNGTAMKNIPPFSILKKAVIPLPPLEEQNNIVAAIEQEESRIKYGIQSHQHIINELEEYRKSIIYQAVTGKIDCREKR